MESAQAEEELIKKKRPADAGSQAALPHLMPAEVRISAVPGGRKTGDRSPGEQPDWIELRLPIFEEILIVSAVRTLGRSHQPAPAAGGLAGADCSSREISRRSASAKEPSDWRAPALAKAGRRAD